jgi:hypothetical protein
MARYHNRYKPERRNPVPLLLMGAPMLPLAAAAAGLYLLHKGAQANPSNPVAGLGSFFSSIIQGATNVTRKTILPVTHAAQLVVPKIKPLAVLAAKSSFAPLLSNKVYGSAVNLVRKDGAAAGTLALKSSFAPLLSNKIYGVAVNAVRREGTTVATDALRTSFVPLASNRVYGDSINAVNGLSGDGIYQACAGLGSIFSNLIHAVDSGMVKSVKVASSVIWQPLQISYDVAIKGQSAKGAFENALNQTKSTVESIAHAASPNAIRGVSSTPASTPASTCATPNSYVDANGNALTYAQYVGLMTAQGLTPLNDDCSGSADSVPPAADPDMTQTSNSVVQDPNQPGGLPGAPGAGGKGKGKMPTKSTTVNPLLLAGGGVGAVALLYFMNK